MENYIAFCMKIDFTNTTYSNGDLINFQEKIVGIGSLLHKYAFRNVGFTQERDVASDLTNITVDGIKEEQQDVGKFNALVLEVGSLVRNADIFKTENDEKLKEFVLKITNNNFDCVEVDLLGDVLSQLKEVKKVLI